MITILNLLVIEHDLTHKWYTLNHSRKLTDWYKALMPMTSSIKGKLTSSNRKSLYQVSALQGVWNDHV